MTRPDWTKAADLPPEELARLLDEDHDEIDDNPPATDEDLSRMTVVERKPGQRGPGRRPARVSVTLRLDPATIDAYKEGGDGWQIRMRDALDRGAPKVKRSA